MQKKNIVVGVGNMLFKDEGIGIYASEYIKQNYEFSDNLESKMAQTFEEKQAFIQSGVKFYKNRGYRLTEQSKR